MTDTRKKLIELLEQAEKNADAKGYYNCAINPKKIELVADHLIVDGVTVQEWIPVTERLPEQVGQPVLVAATNCYGQSRIVKAFLDYDACGFFRTTEKEYDGVWSAWEVTHWMPLPEPPRE